MCLEDGIVYAADFLQKGLKREPNSLLAKYKPIGGTVDNKWSDKRKGKFFNQIYVSSTDTGSAHHYLTSLISAQIDAYKRSRDFNPFYIGRKTPDFVKFPTVRGNLQIVCKTFKSSIGSIELPTKKQKLAQSFTNMTTSELLSLGVTQTRN